MLTITLKQLETFVAVAECNGFRRASERLNLSQSTVTSHVQLLERELGATLLNRTTRSIRLTEAGRSLLARVTETIDNLEDIVINLRRLSSIDYGSVTILSAPSFASSILPSVLADFQRRHPNVSVRFREAFGHEILDALRKEEAEFGIGPIISRQKDFDFQFIMKDQFFAVMSRDNPLAEKEVVNFKEIVDQPILAMPHASAIRKTLETLFASEGSSLRPKFEMLHHETLVAMARAGLGVAILPGIALTPSDIRRLHVAKLARPRLSRDIGIITQRGNLLSATARAFVNAVQIALTASRPAL